MSVSFDSGEMKPATFVNGFSVESEVAKMPYNCLGKTKLQVSKLSIGSGPFGGETLYGSYEAKGAEETLLTALRSGVNFIDCGPHYGLGKAETFVGQVLKKVPREAYYISTKVGRFGNQFDFTAEGVTRSFENSLKRLQLDYVDILFVHDVEFASSIDIIINETLPQLEKFKAAGKAKFIGVTGYPVDTLIEIVEKSNVPIDCVLSYCRDTLIDDTLQEYLPRFAAKGVGVVDAGCIGMRLLSNSGPLKWHPAKQETKHLCKEAAEYCQEKGVELGNIALYHSLNQPGSSTHVVGVNDMDTLRSNLNTLYNGLCEEEEDALRYIQNHFFTPDKKIHWEGIEVGLYRQNRLASF